MITTIEQLLEIYKVDSEDKLDWLSISIHQPLSESFMDFYFDKLKWEWLSCKQILSEDFIEKYSDKLNWFYVSIKQTLSEDFIDKHANKVDWYWVINRQNISKELCKKYFEIIPILSLVKNCGNKNRNIYRLKINPEHIIIGCFKGTKEETIKAIQEKYHSDPVAMQLYIDKVELCFNTTLFD